MLLRKVLFAILVLSLFSGCVGKSSKVLVEKEKLYKYASMKDGILHLDIDKSRHDSLMIDLSMICDTLIYVPLETNKKCLLGNHLNEFFIDGDDIFLQMNLAAYRFKMNGDFVCQFGKLGRGPGEYSCTGLAINTDDKRVYSKANYRHRLYEFDYSGKFLSSKIKTHDWQNDMLYSPLDKTLLYSYNYSLTTDKDIKTDYNMLTAFDLKGKKKYSLESKYFPNKFFVEGTGGRIHIPGSTKYIFDNSLYFQELASDTIFKKEKDTIVPHIVLNNYDFRKPFNSLMFNTKSKSRMMWMMDGHPKFPSKVRGESSRYIFIDYYSEPSYVYDKKERTLSCVDYYKEEVEGDKPGEKKTLQYVYRNDMDGINHIESSWIINNQYLLSKIPAIDFLDNLDKLKASKNVSQKYLSILEKIAEGLTEESNPVMMLARLKK